MDTAIVSITMDEYEEIIRQLYILGKKRKLKDSTLPQRGRGKEKWAMGYYFTTEFFDQAFHKMSVEIIEDIGIEMSISNYALVGGMLSFYYLAAYHHGKGVAFKKEDELLPLVQPQQDSEESLEEVLKRLIQHGYLIHFNDGTYDYYSIKVKFKEFITSHFPTEAMQWEPEYNSEDME
jgi:hypothetical protein